MAADLASAEDVAVNPDVVQLSGFYCFSAAVAAVTASAANSWLCTVLISA